MTVVLLRDYGGLTPGEVAWMPPNERNEILLDIERRSIEAKQAKRKR